MKKTTNRTKAPRNVPPTLGKVLDKHGTINRFKYESIGRIAVLLQELPSSFCVALYCDLLGLVDDTARLDWAVLNENATRKAGVVKRRTRP